MSEIGENIRNARLGARLHQDVLAGRLGIKQTTLSRYEKDREPRAGMMKKIAEACGVSITMLYYGPEASEPQAAEPPQESYGNTPATRNEIKQMLEEFLRKLNKKK